MAEKLQIGIAGYGNLGKGAERSIGLNNDMELKVIFTRRDPSTMKTSQSNAVFKRMEDVDHYVGKLDVMILCGGSATDLPEQGPQLAAKFNIVDSFDTHAKIPEYFAAVEHAAQAAKTTAVISAGWDPGLFSLIRVLGDAVIPDGKNYTFWGPGVSQGHSDAIRRIPGVMDARQYTVPIEHAVDLVRSGVNTELSTRDKHLRDCYVVAEPGADLNQIRTAIVTMPNYFADYETKVNFVSEEELRNKHHGLPHGGFVLRSGRTSPEHKELIEFKLRLDSNPEFTSSVLIACARAAVRMAHEKNFGAKTMFDIPFAYLSARSAEELRRDFL